MRVKRKRNEAGISPTRPLVGASTRSASETAAAAVGIAGHFGSASGQYGRRLTGSGEPLFGMINGGKRMVALEQPRTG